MKTTFETALDQHEISEFFKGEGIYFARGSDWGDHLHVSNWQEMCSVLKNQKAPQSLLTKIFEDYAKYLNEDYSDAEGLLSNISAYYTLKSKIPFLASDSYDLIESLDEKAKKNIGKLFRLLRQEYDIKNRDLPKYKFDEEIKRLKAKGFLFELESL
ncbi:hypothetical protein ACOI9X_13015 [Pseudomonas sp. P2757]|uniref:hypothetical protein n=1 Tax=unclassified Pseudomonas TaxID=196821 RepID=UPI003B5BB1FF